MFPFVFATFRFFLHINSFFYPTEHSFNQSIGQFNNNQPQQFNPVMNDQNFNHEFRKPLFSVDSLRMFSAKKEILSSIAFDVFPCH